MTSTVSTAKTRKESFFRHYFLMGFRRTRKAMIILSVLQIIGIPLTEILMTVTLKADLAEKYDTSEIFATLTVFSAVLSVIFLVCALLAGMFFAIQSFGYLHKKSITDMYYALPVSTNQRFFADFSSGIIAYFVPMIIGFAATLITALACTGAVAEINEMLTAYGVGTLQTLVIKAFLLAFAVMLMFYVLSCLVCTLCGQFFETITYTIVINGLIPGIIAIVFLVLFSNAYGVDFSSYAMNIVRMTSPAGVLIYYLCSLNSSTQLYYTNGGIEGVVRWDAILLQIAYILIFTAVYFAVTYLLYRKRRSEDVGKPFVFSFFYYVITFCMVLCVCSIGVINEMAAYIGSAFASIVFFMIVDAITKRGSFKIKTFARAFVTGIVMTGVSIVFVVICNHSDGFGVVYNIPEADNVKNVTVEFELYGSSLSYEEESLITDLTNISMVTFDDRQGKEMVISMHRDIINNYKNNKDFYDDMNDIIIESVDGENSYGTVNITYKLDSDLTMTRTYFISHNFLDIVGDFLTSDVYTESCFEQIKENFKQDKAQYGFSSIEFYPEIYYYSKDLSGNCFSVELTDSLSDGFFESYEKDIRNKLDSEEDNSGSVMVGSVALGWNSYTIYSSYENTIKFINENITGNPFYTMNFSEGAKAVLNGDIDNANLYDSSMISVTLAPDYDSDEPYYFAEYYFVENNNKAVSDLVDLAGKIEAYYEQSGISADYNKASVIIYGNVNIPVPDEFLDDVIRFAEKYQDEKQSYSESFDEIRNEALKEVGSQAEEELAA